MIFGFVMEFYASLLLEFTVFKEDLDEFY